MAPWMWRQNGEAVKRYWWNKYDKDYKIHWTWQPGSCWQLVWAVSFERQRHQLDVRGLLQVGRCSRTEYRWRFQETTLCMREQKGTGRAKSKSKDASISDSYQSAGHMAWASIYTFLKPPKRQLLSAENMPDTALRLANGQEKSQINNLTLHLKQLEKEEMKNPRVSTVEGKKS